MAFVSRSSIMDGVPPRVLRDERSALRARRSGLTSPVHQECELPQVSDPILMQKAAGYGVKPASYMKCHGEPTMLEEFRFRQGWRSGRSGMNSTE